MLSQYKFFILVRLRDDTDINIIMQNSSYLCQCSTNPHENALYACTCSLLHSLQNSTSKLWFSTLCNHSWKGTSLPQNSACVMKCVVMWKSVIRISTSILLQQPYHFESYFHTSNTTTGLHLHGELSGHSFAYYTSTYLRIGVELTVGCKQFFFFCLKWSLKHTPDICPN